MDSRPSKSVQRRAVILALMMLGLLVPVPQTASDAAVPVAGVGGQLCQSLLIPAYFYPSPPPTLWQQAIAGAPTVKFLIANPANGPGTTIDSNYTEVIDLAKSAGITVLGYVHTTYAGRSLSVVRADVAAWRELYGVKSIFVDEVSSNADDLPYYRKLAKTIRRARHARVVLNPGTVPDPRYLDVGNVVVVFEGTAEMYETYDFPEWIAEQPAKRVAHLVYATADGEAMSDVVALAKARNAGHVFVTDDVLDNPWDTLPPYWSDELTAAAAGCG